MKKYFSLLVLVLFFGTADAQILDMVLNAIPHYAHGTVTYKNGQEEAFTWVELPKFNDTSIRVSNDPKHKKSTTIKAAEVDHITVWTDKLPEKKVKLYYIHADKSKLPFTGLTTTDAWGYPIAGNAWGAVYKCHVNYDIIKKTGEIVGMHQTRQIRNGNFIQTEEVASPCFLVCPDFTNAQLIGGSFSRDNTLLFAGLPKRIAPFFKSNPEIEKQIADRKLSGSDIQFILDEMAIYHNVSTQEKKPEPEEQTMQETSESQTNGTLGDDE